MYEILKAAQRELLQSRSKSDKMLVRFIMKLPSCIFKQRGRYHYLKTGDLSSQTLLKDWKPFLGFPNCKRSFSFYRRLCCTKKPPNPQNH